MYRNQLVLPEAGSQPALTGPLDEHGSTPGCYLGDLARKRIHLAHLTHQPVCIDHRQAAAHPRPAPDR
jgi:hypothetical protein